MRVDCETGLEDVAQVPYDTTNTVVQLTMQPFH